MSSKAGGLDVCVAPCRWGLGGGLNLDGEGVERTESRKASTHAADGKFVFHGAPVRQVGRFDLDTALSLARVLIGAKPWAPPRPPSTWPPHRPAGRQFGQPIGRFQAIKHKLADSLMKLKRAVGVWGALRRSATARRTRCGDPRQVGSHRARCFVTTEATRCSPPWHHLGIRHALLLRRASMQLSLARPTSSCG